MMIRNLQSYFRQTTHTRTLRLIRAGYLNLPASDHLSLCTLAAAAAAAAAAVL